MTTALSDLHAAAIAAQNEALAARTALIAQRVATTEAKSDLLWADHLAGERARAALDALAVFAECLEIKAGP